MGNKVVKILFAIRIVCWTVATAATVYWIYWSFKLYELGFENEHDYASHLRPYMAKGLLIATVSILLSFLLRRISDNIKKEEHRKLLQSEK